LSRTKLAPSRIFEQEALIQEAADEAGFAVIHPQELPLSVQIKMMDHARIVWGIDGSAMHLVAFSRPRTRVVCFNTRKIANASQMILEGLIDASSTHLYIGDKSESEIREMLRQVCFS
jgi:capsular polysaccharide biosynthesis protein